LSAPLIFDKDHYLSLNSSRAKTLGDLLSQFRTQLNLQTAIDIGCGVGFFSEFLRSNGLRVKGVDGRGENIQEARSRHPGIDFTAGDAENLPTEQMGKFDLVLCFGLLYHLENPFRAIRSLERLTEKVLFVEGSHVAVTSLHETMGGTAIIATVSVHVVDLPTSSVAAHSVCV